MVWTAVLTWGLAATAGSLSYDLLIDRVMAELGSSSRPKQRQAESILDSALDDLQNAVSEELAVALKSACPADSSQVKYCATSTD